MFPYLYVICYEDISLHSHFYLFLLLGVQHSRCGFVEIPGVLLVTLTVCYKSPWKGKKTRSVPRVFFAYPSVYLFPRHSDKPYQAFRNGACDPQLCLKDMCNDDLCNRLHHFRGSLDPRSYLEQFKVPGSFQRTAKWTTISAKLSASLHVLHSYKSYITVSQNFLAYLIVLYLVLCLVSCDNPVLQFNHHDPWTPQQLSTSKEVPAAIVIMAGYYTEWEHSFSWFHVSNIVSFYLKWFPFYWWFSNSTKLLSVPWGVNHRLTTNGTIIVKGNPGCCSMTRG